MTIHRSSLKAHTAHLFLKCLLLVSHCRRSAFLSLCLTQQPNQWVRFPRRLISNGLLHRNNEWNRTRGNECAYLHACCYEYFGKWKYKYDKSNQITGTPQLVSVSTHTWGRALYKQLTYKELTICKAWANQQCIVECNKEKIRGKKYIAKLTHYLNSAYFRHAMAASTHAATAYCYSGRQSFCDVNHLEKCRIFTPFFNIFILAASYVL